ncbi:hypothetical protein MANES_01G209200v8 [Manihot esculenta]|nr:hypothetical protein MANES_01G209200v8 [Manihot esculenta]KAG8663410.1 hypothetical protein MANES_01G209200v8 [Manihot esculenta]KAG8663411.1 hypothetical protein MANES_01G209200v8 [Manihot esculenta]KAG8663412.1 hypothetical protein MANES_01G209200v8 [Manihot esculenta]
MPVEINGLPEPARSMCVSQINLANYACGRLAPSPASEVLNDHEHKHGHGHKHRHRHRHGKFAHETPAQSCCRWLDNVDNECVCDLLIHLPAFLSKPAHQITVVIGEICRVKFSCSGRVRP